VNVHSVSVQLVNLNHFYCYTQSTNSTFCGKCFKGEIHVKRHFNRCAANMTSNND